MSKYILFTQEQHEKIRWDYTQDMIDRVLDLWKEGYAYNVIAKSLGLRRVEVTLVLLDLAERGKVPARSQGMFGNVVSDEI